jgi:hypothetical protein
MADNYNNSKLVSTLISALDISGCLTNGLALLHIYRSFNLKIHAFSLLFIDSIISTASSLFLTLLHILYLTNQVEHSEVFCTLEFLGFFLPFYLGACTTFLVASIRLLLTIQSAQNKHPSNVKVSVTAFVAFGTAAAVFLLYIGISSATNAPFSFTVETCTRTKRHISTLNELALQVPSFFNILSLMVDLRLLKFVRKSVTPLTAFNNQSLAVIAGKLFLLLLLVFLCKVLALNSIWRVVFLFRSFF